MAVIPQSGLPAQVSFLRLPLEHSGLVLTLSIAAHTSLPSPCLLVLGAGVSVLLLHWGSYHWAHNLWVLIIYLFLFPVMFPSVVPRISTDSAVRVFPGVWKPLFLRLLSQDRAQSLPLLSLFLSFIFFPTSFQRQFFPTLPSCSSGCQISSVGIQKLFHGIYSEFKSSFDEFVGEKVISLSYSSTILGPPPRLAILSMVLSPLQTQIVHLDVLDSCTVKA